MNFNYEEFDDDQLEELVNELEKSGAFETCEVEQTIRLETDPEWSVRRHTHCHSLMEAWAYGVLSSFAYFRNYQLPDNFEKVFKHIAMRLNDKFPDEVVPKISLCEIRQWFKQWAMELEEFREWNTLPGSQVTHRYSSLPSGPTFIDLDVPSHNAALFIRNQRRIDDEFDRKFKEQYGSLED